MKKVLGGLGGDNMLISCSVWINSIQTLEDWMEPTNHNGTNQTFYSMSRVTQWNKSVDFMDPCVFYEGVWVSTFKSCDNGIYPWRSQLKWIINVQWSLGPYWPPPLWCPIIFWCIVMIKKKKKKGGEGVIFTSFTDTVWLSEGLDGWLDSTLAALTAHCFPATNINMQQVGITGASRSTRLFKRLA